MMTEEEAKTKWCPNARIAMIAHGESVSCASNRDISLLVAPNSFDPATDVTKCLASGCMAWRWIDNELGYDPEYRRRNPSCVERLPLENRRGFCGLAGKP
jgi:hypothetical protein